jgi:hypothetical protein
MRMYGGAAFVTLPLVGRVAGRREGFFCGGEGPSPTPPHKGEGSTHRPASHVRFPVGRGGLANQG